MATRIGASTQPQLQTAEAKLRLPLAATPTPSTHLHNGGVQRETRSKQREATRRIEGDDLGKLQTQDIFIHRAT
jgi:hypothetical protein